MSRFSIKQMLLAMIGFALAASFCMDSVNGSVVGYCVTVALVVFPLLFVTLGLVHWVAYRLAQLVYGKPARLAEESAAAAGPSLVELVDDETGDSNE